MKKLFRYSAFFFLFALLSIALFFNSCKGITKETKPEEIKANSAIYPQIPLNQNIKDKQGQHPPIIIDNQILVDLDGENISDITDLIPIEEVESCTCGDSDIKLLTLPDGFNPETAIATVRDNDDSRVKADKNFKFTFKTRGPYEPEVVNPTLLDLGFIVELESSSGTTEPVIAIVDTGIFPKAFRKNEISLFKPSSGCSSGTAGWNFVDNNNDVSDKIMHGTFVAKRIAKRIKELDASASTTTNYRILPLKVFSNGRGEYFDVVCAFSYIQQLIEEEEVNIPLINASFGSSLGNLDLSDLMVLKKYIDELGQSTIIVASAGNEGEDNTQTAHFPSGYNNQINFGTADIEPSNNIVAVAGYEANSMGQIQLVPKTNVDPKIGSNFGELNVDLAAPWVFQVKEDKVNGQSIEISGLQGTSYSAAYVSGDLLHFIVNNTNNSTLSPPIPTFLSEYYNNIRINTSNIQVIGGKYVE